MLAPYPASYSPCEALTEKPSYSFLVITLITPATASEPYIDEAPSLRISTRLIIETGIVCMSTLPYASVTHLLPSTKTNVLPDPRFLSDTSLAPLPPLVEVLTGRIPDPSDEVMFWSTSPMLFKPVRSMASSEIISKGFELSRFDLLILEPVTITSSTSSSSADESCAKDVLGRRPNERTATNENLNIFDI